MSSRKKSGFTKDKKEEFEFLDFPDEIDNDLNPEEDLFEIENSLNESYGFRRHRLVSDEEYSRRTEGNAAT